jgi:AcrR family transcriptional regulator
MFDEVGVDAAAMSDIARRAGVGPGTLWRQFPDKAALVAAVVGDSLDGLADLATELMNAVPPADPLRQWVCALIQHIARYRGLASAFAHASAHSSNPLGVRRHAAEHAAAELVERTHTHGQVRPDLTGTEVIQLATAVAWINEATAPPDTTARLLDLIFEGLRLPQGRAAPVNPPASPY